MHDLEGRTALVTGGSRGIGRAISIRLAEAGADVAINYARNAAAAEEVAETVRKHGRRAGLYRADVADYAACKTMVAGALGDLGRIDILVNNAGIGSAAVGRPRIADARLEDLQRLFGANLWGPIHLCRLLIPQMREARRGDVIMISSVAAQMLAEGFGTYSIGKAGMEALAHTLAREERPHGIRVNIVAPGLVETDMGASLIKQMLDLDDMTALAEQAPFGLLCQPEDIANAVVFLCSEQARYVTNQRLTVDGGGS
jgi:NAD(P)-dependent dehydrogenase (short-subunit alcohol dehydrogenase family)